MISYSDRAFVSSVCTSRALLAAILTLYLLPNQALSSCEHQSDGEDYNQMSEFSIKLGPPGVQHGHPNPVGIPPSLVDLQLDYTTPCGSVWGVSVSPGLTYGRRYRSGPVLYGDLGGGLIISVHGANPGVYAALGASIERTQKTSLDFEFKKALAWNIGGDGLISTPYAFRIGMSYRW